MWAGQEGLEDDDMVGNPKPIGIGLGFGIIYPRELNRGDGPGSPKLTRKMSTVLRDPRSGRSSFILRLRRQDLNRLPKLLCSNILASGRRVIPVPIQSIEIRPIPLPTTKSHRSWMSEENRRGLPFPVLPTKSCVRSSVVFW